MLKRGDANEKRKKKTEKKSEKIFWRQKIKAYKSSETRFAEVSHRSEPCLRGKRTFEVCTYGRLRVRTYVRTFVRTYVRTHARTYIHMYVRTYECMCAHVHTYVLNVRT